ncbi:hypothetical protein YASMINEVIRUS_343 [Yasminevirus sp. GU-2018]|uniref:LicD/FKTN/FKRP nucleotidyltransferase domain-containing protein n=1 Tax=Yasminevirus sp. GU-2018 TaxID=2420051 RepID=A0A5K0U7W6_9VIRU|nr:hypothetical protein YASMINEVIRUS_343 [Yasminevirus sp. GU-2018]
MDKLKAEIVNTEYLRGLAQGVDLVRNEEAFMVAFSRHYMLFRLLKLINDTFIANGIDYALIGGGLIGVYRHNNSFTPWDDDLDIVIKKADFTKVKDALKDNPEVFLCGNNPDALQRIYFTYCKEMKNTHQDDRVFIDIFYVDTNILASDDNKDVDNYRYTSPEHRRIFPNEYFLKDELFPTQNEDFNMYLPDGKLYDTIKVSVPNKARTFLDRAYPGWPSSIKITQTHSAPYKLSIVKQVGYIGSYLTQYWCPCK